eukprot:15364454-Ditylum_brightwellii.AAC.1
MSTCAIEASNSLSLWKEELVVLLWGSGRVSMEKKCNARQEQNHQKQNIQPTVPCLTNTIVVQNMVLVYHILVLKTDDNKKIKNAPYSYQKAHS